jgi:hypothetical protein
MSIIPFPYNLIAGSVLFVAVIGGAFAYWKHSVATEVNKEIAAYVAKKTKDDQALEAIDVRTNIKIETQYVDRVKTITVQGKDNVQTIIQYVHDNELLSNGWVRDHDISAAGGSIGSPTSTDSSPSTFTAVDALTTVSNNYATCNIYKEQVIAWQNWFAETNANITKQNALNAKKK